jgi:hypothetical protein
MANPLRKEFGLESADPLFGNMPDDLTITVTKDTASHGVAALVQALASNALRRHVGAAATVFTQAHLRSLSGNKMGWVSQDFYEKAARGTAFDTTPDGIRITVENEDAPGAMKHQYNKGEAGQTRIDAVDKLLTIPAREEFYGHRAGEFDNLRFVQFASGAKALVIGKGGTNLVNFGTGKGSAKGTGARTASMIAYWLSDSVTQTAKPEVLPTREQYLNVIRQALEDGLAQLTGRSN